VSVVLGVGQNCPEVFLEDFLAVFVEFDKGDCSESCPLSGKSESADTAEEVEVRRLTSCSSVGRKLGLL
jgi:hypothetical protein